MFRFLRRLITVNTKPKEMGTLAKFKIRRDAIGRTAMRETIAEGINQRGEHGAMNGVSRVLESDHGRLTDALLIWDYSSAGRSYWTMMARKEHDALNQDPPF